jgi:sugar O-acyltransferase (sialic acid O-acetyltransferase NeuD family)
MQQMLQQLNHSMDNKVNLYGASGHCKVIVDAIKSTNFKINDIVDDNPKNDKLLGIEVKAVNKFNWDANSKWIISIGNNKTRQIISKKLNVKFTKAIHKSAVVSDYSSISEGTVVMALAVINSDVKIGKHCIINTGAIIEHDCEIEDFVHVSPKVAIAGNVTIGEGSHIGIGASIIPGIKIGKWATIGAGAVIIRNIPDYAVVVGNPGKIIKYNQEND